MKQDAGKTFSYGKLYLSRDGVWYHEGVEITHARTIELFNRNLRREGDRYVLRVGREMCEVEIEDAPFLVKQVNAKGDDLFIELSNYTTEPLDTGTLEIGEKNVLYARVGPQKDRAKFTRPAYYQLTNYLHQDDEERYFLKVGNKDFPLNF